MPQNSGRGLSDTSPAAHTYNWRDEMSTEVEIATLETKLENLTNSIAALTATVKENNEKLERLAVLEVAHNNSSKDITDLKKELRSHIERDDQDHKTYDKWIWIVTGFCAAISILWTVVGYRMNAMIDEQVSAAAEMKLHIREDKIKDISDLQKIIPLWSK